jgi:hypothetical protein
MAKRLLIPRCWSCTGLVVALVLSCTILTRPVAAQEQGQEQVLRAQEERLQAIQRQVANLERQLNMLREQLQELNARLERTLGGGERENDAVRREREAQRREGGEREVVQRHIETMRLALPALEEVGRKDSAELLEKAIRAREVSLEGRRDADATRIRSEAPKLREEIELVTFASRLWREAGNIEHAEALTKLAEELRERGNRQRDREVAKQEAERKRLKDDKK